MPRLLFLSEAGHRGVSTLLQAPLGVYLQVLLPGGELALLPAVQRRVNMQEGHVLAGRRTLLPT